MHDRPHVPVDTVAACALWAVTFACLIASGALFIFEHRDSANFLGYTSVVLSAASGTVTLKGWIAQVNAGVRTATNLARGASANRPRRIDD